MTQFFALSTGDTRFDPMQPVTVNGYVFVPAPVRRGVTFGMICSGCGGNGVHWGNDISTYCDECHGTGVVPGPNCRETPPVSEVIDPKREAIARVRDCPSSPTGKHIVDTSMESGPNNCFHCERPM